jgi:acetolactate synthase-1/2/3 large subunit
MPDAVGRLTGRIGLCQAQTGQGATNLRTRTGCAHRYSIPVLVITCNTRISALGRDDTQGADHLAIFRWLTKWAPYVGDVTAIPRAVREGVMRAMSGSPDPVLVELAHANNPRSTCASYPSPTSGRRS